LLVQRAIQLCNCLVVAPEHRDRRLLYAVAFLRALTTSAIGVTLGAYLARLGLRGAELGAVLSCGLAGAALAAVIATFVADRVGRRRFLIALAALGAIGTAAFAVSSSPFALAATAFVGMVNGMGRDRGGALILEIAALPSTAPPDERTRVIARYTMLQDVGHAVGALLAGVPAWLADTTQLGELDAHRGLLLACAAFGVVALTLYLGLGRSIERGAATRLRFTARSRAIVAKISALFALDGLGGGFLTTAMLSYFFFERFGADERVIALLFFGARALNALSHLGAAWLAARIGLVRTMVLTHLPSSLLLVTVAFAPSFAVAALLFLVREGLVEMDVPTRQSYVMAVVEPDERTLASGITNLVRLATWAVAPAVAGVLMGDDLLYAPLLAGAAMKIAYDLLLWRAFRHVRPPEER
jgi:MFS family permease